MKITMIAAVDAACGIGKAFKIPWKNKADSLHFIEKTTPGPDERIAMIVGAITYKDLRETVHDRVWVFPVGRCYKVTTLDEALDTCRKMGFTHVILGGGRRIYQEGLKHASEIWLSRIPGDHACDAFWPWTRDGIPPGWKVVSEEKRPRLLIQKLERESSHV